MDEQGILIDNSDPEVWHLTSLILDQSAVVLVASPKSEEEVRDLLTEPPAAEIVVVAHTLWGKLTGKDVLRELITAVPKEERDAKLFILVSGLQIDAPEIAEAIQYLSQWTRVHFVQRESGFMQELQRTIREWRQSQLDR